MSLEINEIHQDAADGRRRSRTNAPGRVHLADDGSLHLLLKHHRGRVDADVVSAERHGVCHLDGKEHVNVGRPGQQNDKKCDESCRTANDGAGAVPGHQPVCEHERQERSET